MDFKVGIKKIAIFAFFVSFSFNLLSSEKGELTTKKPVKEEKGKISLDLKGVDIIELLRVLSLKTGLTIVSSKGVSGRVNIFLNNVDFKDALDIILITQNLACERKGNVIYVMTAAEYKKMYGKDYVEKRKYKSIKLKYASPSNVFKVLTQLKSDIGKIIADESSGTIILLDIPEKLKIMENAIKQLDTPLETYMYTLNYADPKEVKNRLANIITPGVGKIIIDERASKVIISDLPSKIEKIKKILKNLDAEEKEVFIEAEIVQVNLNKEFRRGIDWEKVFSERKLDGLDFIGKFPVTPALNAYGEISVGTIDRDKYKAVLDFLQSYGDVKILSRPRIAVVNNQEAKIMVGKREAYVTQTLSQAQTTTVTSESIEFIDVGVKLNVVPAINEEGFIIMKINPEVSTVSETITTSLGSRIPIVETSEAETVVKVKDGTMIMIAGLMKEERRDRTAGIPGLSNIPFLRGLFGSRDKLTRKTELIIFITPYLISGDFTVKGTEPQKFIPKEIMPQDIKKKIFLKEIENIKPLSLLENKDSLKQNSEIINKRLKGLKTY